MTKSEIMDALCSGQKVWWSSTRYEVVIDEDMPTGLATRDKYNGYYIALSNYEFEDCFIQG